MFSANDKRFLGEVVALCHEHEISIKLPFQKSVAYCGGFFDEETFATAMNRSSKEALDIIVHEYSHIEQYLDPDSPWYSGVWQKYGDTITWDYLGGTKEFSDIIISKSFKASVAVELDCEKRAVENIKKFKLSLDIPYYTRKGNAYLFSYYYFRKHQCWYDPKHKVYENKTIMKAMPDTYHDTVDDYWKRKAVIWNFLDKYHKSLVKI